MGMKSYKVHYKNKYPDCEVRHDDRQLDVFWKGKHMVRLEKDGHGVIRDVSEEHGCEAKHDLSELPRDARAHKLHRDGRVGLDEEYKERRAKAAQYVEAHGCVPSMAELDKKAKEAKVSA